MMTPAVAGQASVCFSCGQPLPKDIVTSVMSAPPAMSGSGPAPQPAVVAVAVAGGPPSPLVGAFPLTSAQPSALEPPPNPYGSGPTAASLVGAAGKFAIRSGVEVRVGRDPAACPITLTEPRVSGVHATLMFEGGSLRVRDEASNNGTYVNGARIAASVWTPVPHGAALRFGPVEFTVKLD
jgi:hypothetical protein